MQQTARPADTEQEALSMGGRPQDFTVGVLLLLVLLLKAQSFPVILSRKVDSECDLPFMWPLSLVEPD